MTSMHTFGHPERFEIAARWIDDPEPRERLPKEYGWSMGELRIKVGGVNLTEHRIHGEAKEAIQWYLGPVVSWLIKHWKWLLHEEAYSWQTRPGDSAAVTVAADLERYIASEYAPDRGVYKTVREWWKRHALHSADSSALYPDILIRRVDDQIEISWLDGQPEFPPKGFELNLKPGVALFAVEDVAKPLWDFLQWTIDSARVDNASDRQQVQSLRSRLDSVRQSDAAELEATHVADAALGTIMDQVRAESNWIPDRKVLVDPPVVTEFDTPALMFGGLNVSMGEADVRVLFDLLARHRGGIENDRLKSLISAPSIYEYIKPYAHGYELAYQAREALGIGHQVAFVDVEAFLEELGVAIHDIALETNSVRGVAIAGIAFGPAILVNENSTFNADKRGRRFTLAHEFCHILYDRANARRLSHISGPWAAARIEKRANAFAAMFLATPHALERALGPGEIRHQFKHLSEKFGIGSKALREHMLNLDLITDVESFGRDERRY